MLLTRMLGLPFALCLSVADANLNPLKWMAHSAGWGAANDAKYGRDQGEWEAHSARHATHLDALTDALAEDPLVKHLDLMSENAAWGAANERAYGASRSGSQVDWDRHRSFAQKVKESVGNDEFAVKLEGAAKHAAWYAANKYTYGEGNEDTKHSLQQFKENMEAAKKLVPSGGNAQKLSMKDVEGLFKSNALRASSHRSADLLHQKRKRRSEEHHYETDKTRTDWKQYYHHAAELQKQLGPEQSDLFDHFEGMCIESALGATAERTLGKHSNDAQTHWQKYTFHYEEAKGLYKGPAQWVDIRQMVSEAAWGAANERAYGASSSESKNAWKSFNSAADRVDAAYGQGEL